MIQKAVGKFGDHLLLLALLALLKLELCTAASTEANFEEGLVQGWCFPALYTFTSEGKVPPTEQGLWIS